MRSLILALSAAAIAGPALAGPLPPLGLLQDSQLLQQREAIRQQLIQQHNDLTTLEAQWKTQQALANIQAQAYSPQLALPDVALGYAPPNMAASQVDPGQFASIPDSVLADSNRKVLEAAGRR